MFWLGAIVSLCYIPGVTGAYIATQWPVLAVLLTFGLFRSGPITIFHGLWVLFLAYATVHAGFTPDPYFSVFGLWLVWIMTLCLWFGTTLSSLQEIRDLYAGLALGAAVSSAVSIAQHFGFDIVQRVSAPPAGLYVNSIQQGTVLALIVVALLTEGMWRWTLPLLPGIALSGSRGALVVLAVGVLALFIRRARLLGGVVAATATYLLLVPLSPSDSLRMVIWNAAWQGLTFWGWGPGVFYTVMIPQPGGWILPEHAHNDALQLAFEYGIGALLAFAVFGFALWRTRAREWPVVVAFLAAGCFSMPLWMPVASFLALVAVGRILRDYALVRGERDHGGLHVLSRGWQWTGWCGEDVPVASHHQTKG